ncbi:MAG: hypothetical protein KGM42_20470 [Hyphomicrobiales bacterium]|nr:hypothetical protein [Hyphomicrobiales bacterium]
MPGTFLKATMVGGLVLVGAAVASAQDMRPLMTNVQWSAYGKTFVVVFTNTRVTGAECVTVTRSKGVGLNYAVTQTATRTAEKKDGGVLCTGGGYRLVGQDGQSWSGSNDFNVFVKGGVAYRMF